MILFLDTSVVLAACGSAVGASRVLFDRAEAQDWQLLASNYVVLETELNLPNLPASANEVWPGLKQQLTLVPDVVTFDWVTVFAPAKDRPILFTALAWADVLLTLDRNDFQSLIGFEFYGLSIMKPGEFLAQERDAGRWQF